MKREVKEKLIKSGCEAAKESVQNRKREKLLTRKKAALLALAALMAAAFLAGCGNGEEKSSGEDEKQPISVIAREDGSGTRAAFNELMGITKDNIDYTTSAAEISQSTAVVMSGVAGNKNAIAYISLGSMRDSVKAVSIDGAEATAENIKNGTYAAARSFLLLTGKRVSAQAEDFLAFMLSKEGQEIVAQEGYVTANENAASYDANKKISGKIVVAGSTSVAPVVQKLADAYKRMHEGITIEIQQTGSGAGITSVLEAACDLGMSSRELKPEERAEGIQATEIALDGIVVIVNKDNSTDGLTSEEIRRIFTGEFTDWSEVK